MSLEAVSLINPALIALAKTVIVLYYIWFIFLYYFARFKPPIFGILFLQEQYFNNMNYIWHSMINLIY